MTNRFHNTSSSLNGPASDAFAITPDDNTGLGEITRTVYIGSSGDI